MHNGSTAAETVPCNKDESSIQELFLLVLLSYTRVIRHTKKSQITNYDDFLCVSICICIFCIIRERSDGDSIDHHFNDVRDDLFSLYDVNLYRSTSAQS